MHNYNNFPKSYIDKAVNMKLVQVIMDNIYIQQVTDLKSTSTIAKTKQKFDNIETDNAIISLESTHNMNITGYQQYIVQNNN